MKKFIYSIIILIFLIIITLMLIFNIKEQGENDYNNVQEDILYNKEEIENISDYEEALIVQNCIQNYISNMYIPQNILNMLNEFYINENNITVENLFEKVERIEPIYNFYAKNIYKKEVNSNITQYFMSGRLKNTLLGDGETELTEDEKEILYFSVLLDKSNKTFSIIPYSENDGKREENIEIPILYLEKEMKNYRININNNNAYHDSLNPTTQDELRFYVDNFIYEVKYFTEETYYEIEETYRQAKFSGLEEYRNNINQILNINSFDDINSYSVNEFSDYTQLICQYNGNKTIIINKYSALNFNIILDTYTIDLPNFTEKYYTSNEQEKVVMNIERIFTAINDQDYKFVYNHLDEEFKNNNFKDISQLSNYIQENLYEKNNINYDSFRTQGELFIYDIQISNQERLADPEKDLTIIMKLEEGTDFIMSFGVRP